MRPLTDLELTALANVWKKGGATAYQVMQEFARSTSAYYRGGAGSIYPIMARLARRGLIQPADATRGRRSAVQYRATPRGLAALRKWLSSPPAESEILLPPDPIRTRIYFFGALTPAQQQRVLAAAEAALREQLAVNREVVKKMRAVGNRYGVLAMRGAIEAVQARLRWLTRLQRQLR
jgi:DNA-binding PadR family transcriptional regulator